MSDSEGSSSDFELVSHDSVKVAAPPSSGTVAQSASHSVSAGVGRPGFSATLRLATQDIVGRPTSSGSPATESTRRSLNTQLTHSQHAHAQSPPVTDSEYDALSESSMDEADHGLSRDAAGLERAMRVIASVKPSDSAVQDGRFSAFLSGHLSSSSVSETSSSCDLRASHSSLSHSTVSTTTSNDTDDDADAGANAQTPLVTSPLANALNGPAAANHGMAAMNQGDPFPSTFPMSVAHLPTFTLTHANSGGRQDEAPAAHHHQEQFTLPGADTDTDTDDERPLMDMDQVSKSNNAVGHHGFNCDLVMRSRLVHHGFVSRPTSDSFGPEDFEELGSIPTQGAQAQESEPDAHLDSVIDVTPQRSQMGTLANASAAELPDMFDVHRVSDTSALAVAAGETHLRDTASTAADPNGLMQLLPDFETDATRLTPAASGTGESNDAPRPTLPRKSETTPPRSTQVDLSPPCSPASPTDPAFAASDASLHLISGGSPCPCPSCDLRPGGPGWSLFHTPGPRKYLTASMRKYADAHATHRMHARVRQTSIVSTRIAHLITLGVGMLIGWLATMYWVHAGMLATYQREVRGLHAQLAQGAAHVQGTRVAVNQVYARVAAQGSWIKAEVHDVRIQVKQLAHVLQAYQRAVVEGGGRGRGVVERFSELMKRADEFLGRVGGMHGHTDAVEKEGHDHVAEEKAQEKEQDEAIMVEDVVVTGTDAVPTDEAVPMPPSQDPDQAPAMDAADEARASTPQPETKYDSSNASTDDHNNTQDDPHAIVESPMSLIAQSIVHAVLRIGKNSRNAVLATARALDRMTLCVHEWRARAKAKLQWWLEESRAAKARRARAVPVDQRSANEGVKQEDQTSPTENEVHDARNLNASPVSSAALHATMLREKLRQAQEYLRSVERQEPAEGAVVDKWERIQWANRMSAAKDTLRVAREDLERQLGPGADRA